MKHLSKRTTMGTWRFVVIVSSNRIRRDGIREKICTSIARALLFIDSLTNSMSAVALIPVSRD